MTKSKIQRLILLFVFFSVLVLPSFFLFAKENLEEICEKIEEAEKNLTEENYKLLLEKCEKYYEKEISNIEGDIKETSKEKKTLQNKIQGLKKKIKSLDKQISQNNIVIKDIGVQIKDTQSSIKDTSFEIEDSKAGLGNILREIYEEDQKGVIEILLVEEKLSDFFDNLAALEILNNEIKEEVKNIKDLKSYLEVQEGSLDKEKGDLENVVFAQTLQKKESQKTKEGKDWLLKKTKGEEALYQKHLKETQEKAKEIRQRIFKLAQIPETDAPSLEEAYELAVYIETITGIRPALLLGLLKQESAIGQNVGQCNCDSRSGCRHPKLTYKKVMRESQWGSFEKITKELGLDINTTPISCYINGGKVQWGGAMGPAQFMPNTWLGKGLSYGYKQKVEIITGEIPANPWRIKDAFLAMGLYLQDFGAGNKKLKTEIGAVTAYLCGSPCMTSRCKKAGGKGYRSKVMKNASKYQGYIDEGVFD